MNEIDKKVGEILKLEENSREKLAEEKTAVDNKIKDALKKKEIILEEAEAAAQKKGEELENSRRRDAQAEAKKIILDAEIAAKKISHRILGEKEKIFKILFSALDDIFGEKK